MNRRYNDINSNNKGYNKDTAQYYDMIVFCHYRWQFVYQRPQHIIGRLSSTLKVLFIEEPLPNITSNNSGNLIIVSDNLHVLQPNVRDVESIAEIIPEYVNNKSVPVGWFYSALFSPLLEQLNFQTVVYDCMDEPYSMGADSKQLMDNEKILMAHADIVFTNGKSLYQSKKQTHPNVHLFPGSVDKFHFSKPLSDSAVPKDMEHIQSPVVGYYGVIDERIDFSLLHQTALRLPNVSFVMIGPFVSDEFNLLNEPNIHFLGMKPYEEIPQYLKTFDIAMMPFAINDTTKYIGQAKTLEYMAAGKPIISTKTNDMVSDYRICVNLIETVDDFCSAITFLLDKIDRLSLEMEYYNILKKTSWDATASKMESMIKSFSK
jgi:glycosyltransferase involved in cell wall biosynthesis